MRKVDFGKEPTNVLESWDITVPEITEYLQTQFNNVTRALRSGGNQNIKDVDVRLSVTRMSKQFAVGTLILPLSVLKNKKTTGANVFSGDDGDNIVFESHIYQLINHLSYTKDDKNYFMSEKGRHTLHLSSRDVATLMDILKPKKITLKDLGTYIIIGINLMKVFGSMLSSGENDRFVPEIKNMERLSETNYKFTVGKHYDSKKGVSTTDIERAVYAQMVRRMSPTHQRR